MAPEAARNALALFDALPAVPLDFMLGAWTGESFPSGHPLDGALEACHWHGKRFDSADEVHPLVFRSLAGGRFHVNPAWVGPAIPLVLRFPALKARPLGRLAQALLPLAATRRSRARLRMTSHRGRLTATLVYDGVPILDVFRRMDGDTALGLMDFKGMAQPFFFRLRREQPPS